MLAKSTNKIILYVFSILLLLTIFHNTSINYLSDIGYYSLLALLVFSSVLLIYIAIKDFKTFFFDNRIILIFYFGIVALCFIGMLRNLNHDGISTFIECVLLLNFFLAVSFLRFEKEYFDYNFFGAILALIIVIMFIGMIGDETYQRAYMSIYDNSSAFGLRAFSFGCIALMMYAISDKKYFLLLTVLFFVLVVFSNTRSSIFNALLIVIGLAIYKIISKNSKIWYATILSIFVLTFVLVVVYPLMSTTEIGEVLQRKTVELTGKGFFSGRQIAWLNSIEAIKEKPIFGYGTGKKLYEIINMERKLPTHSLLLQMWLENGIFYMIAICGLLITIWSKFNKLSQNKIVKYSSILFLSILFQSIFEVTLLQGNMLVGVLQWFIIAIGISACRYKNNI